MSWRDYGTVQNALGEICKAIEVLEKNGQTTHVDDLNARLEGIENGTPFIRKEMFLKIAEMCHPRDLGDLYIIDVDWNERCSKLKASCRKAYKRLEADFDQLSQDQRNERG